jgi:hypothetical protein
MTQEILRRDYEVWCFASMYCCHWGNNTLRRMACNKSRWKAANQSKDWGIRRRKMLLIFSNIRDKISKNFKLISVNFVTGFIYLHKLHHINCRFRYMYLPQSFARNFTFNSSRTEALPTVFISMCVSHKSHVPRSKMLHEFEN